jgi:hypothetical protein
MTESLCDHSNCEDRVFLSSTSGLVPASRDNIVDAPPIYDENDDQHRARGSLTPELLPYVSMDGDNDSARKGD